MSDQNEYIVTVKKDVNWLDVHNEIINDTVPNDAVDSNIIQTEPVSVVKKESQIKETLTIT